MFLRLGEQGSKVGIVLLVLEDDMTMRQQVEETIEVIRPALQADGGDIILREVDVHSFPTRRSSDRKSVV